MDSTSSPVSEALARVERAGARGVRGIGTFGAAALTAGLVLSACSSGGSSAPRSTMSPPSTTGASDSVAASPTVVFHGLRLSGGYVPQPASPDVAAAYLTIDNTTAHAQRLAKIVTNVTRSVMAMNETDTGSVGSMTDISRVVIPARSVYRFVPDHAHLMLQHPQHLVVGDRVSMTLTFTPAGSITVQLPVVPIGETPQQAPSPYRSPGGSSSGGPSSSGSAPSMPGMSMSSGG